MIVNVFILSTGRCGSTTFTKACQHINNYTVLHESKCTELGINRFDYPENHIEADNRLSWFLGRLDQKYGDDAFYVHLSRNLQQTITSFSRRESFGIMKAYKEGILLGGEIEQSAEEIAADYIQTIESNISCFLKDKSNKMLFSLENARTDFEMFWKKIEATGDLEAALGEWGRVYNAS